MARDRSARVSPNGQQKKRVLVSPYSGLDPLLAFAVWGATYKCRFALQSAINKAAEFHVSVAKWMGRMPEAPVFHPTPEEWKKPMAYIRKIRPEAEPFGKIRIIVVKQLYSRLAAVLKPVSMRRLCCAGICKIIPPMTSSVPASTVSRTHNSVSVSIHLTGLSLNLIARRPIK